MNLVKPLPLPPPEKSNVRSKKGHNTQESGQSLVEVILAVAVAVIIIVALVGVTVMAIRNADFAKKKALATKYAQEWIEQARQLRDGNPSSFFTAEFIAATPCERIEDVGSIFSGIRECKDLTDDGGKKTVTIKVTISWTDSRGKHDTILTTKLSNWK